LLRSKLAEWRRIGLVALLTAAFMWGLLYAPTPFVVFEPGLAVPVAPMMQAEESDAASEGVFLLTAVKMVEPNMLKVIASVLDADRDILAKRAVLGGYSEKEYAERLTIVMEGSQNNAVEAAYRYLDLPYDAITSAIVVSDIKKGEQGNMAVLKPGDRLLGMQGGRSFSSTDDMVTQLQQLESSQIITLDIERDGQKRKLEVYFAKPKELLTVVSLPASIGAAGLTELRSLKPSDSGNRLRVSAGAIGGPSAGLIFALQAIDLLTEGDLTGGHRIAATGTITPDGKIGPIGGIKQKVVITSEKGAELFLVPAGNYDEAVFKAKSLGTKMQIVKVETLSDAIDQIKSY